MWTGKGGEKDLIEWFTISFTNGGEFGFARAKSREALDPCRFLCDEISLGS